MANVHDVIAYIFERLGSVTAMKLQKLLYYTQAWSLVWDDEPMFENRIEAWANGPVIPDVYQYHRGEFRLTGWQHGDPAKLTKAQRDTIDAVVDFYGDWPAHKLSDLTHRERPWLEAREGLQDGESSNREITPAAMAEFYGSL